MDGGADVDDIHLGVLQQRLVAAVPGADREIRAKLSAPSIVRLPTA